MDNTPLTDAAQFTLEDRRSMGPLVPASFAKKLEIALDKERKHSTGLLRELDAEKYSRNLILIGLRKYQPKTGAWESDCYLCGAHTEVGEIPHKEDCPFKFI
jgi:hypothetical protein